LKTLISLILLSFCFVSTASAVAKVTISMEIFKQYTLHNMNGGTNINWRQTKKIVSGDTIKYIVHCLNDGDIPARNVIVNNQIPEGTTLVHKTAISDSAQVLFSLDGKLYGEDIEFRQRINSAFDTEIEVPIDHSHFRFIRWIVEDIPPKETRVTEFQINVN